MSGKPFVSTIIPHRGGDSALELCIKAIRQQDYPADAIETLIVLNEPTDRTLAFPLIDGEKLLWEPMESSYAARNRGILNSTGEVIVLTDSDTQPYSNWVTEAVFCLNERTQLVAGAIEVTHSNPPNASALFEMLYAFDQERNVKLGQSVTANLIAKKSVFEIYGLFDGHAKSGEDFEWTKSATSLGAVLVYCDKAIVKHPARESFLGLLKKAYRTTLLLPAGPTRLDSYIRVFRRIKLQLIMRPSSSRRRVLTPPQRFIAHVMRICLVMVKAPFLVVLLLSFFLPKK